MAYQLEYKFRELNKRTKKKNRSFNFVISVMLLVAVAIAARFGGTALEIMIFGKHQNISCAATQMVTHLQDGMSFGEAVYTFCQEITYE